MGKEWRITASDHSGFKLECKHGIISLYDEYGNMLCEFMEDDIICKPEYLGENQAIGCRIGECQCGNILRSYQNFCGACGIELDWENVRG